MWSIAMGSLFCLISISDCSLFTSRVFDGKMIVKTIEPTRKLLLQSMSVNGDTCGASTSPNSRKRVKRVTDPSSDSSFESSSDSSSEQPRTVVTHGFEAEPDQFPWQISLQMKAEGNHFCGATLISECHAVTAGHCLSKDQEFEIKPKEMRAVYGSVSNQLHGANPAKSVDVKRLIKHSQYVDIPFDIGLVQFTKRLNLTKSVMPACLPLMTRCTFDGQATLTGFGIVSDKVLSPTKKLKAGQVLILPKDECQQTLRTTYFDPKSMLCQEKSATGACNGDSGGPLISRRAEDNRAVLRGVTSWVLGSCGGENRTAFTVYTDVCFFRDWIMTAMEKYPCDPKT